MKYCEKRCRSRNDAERLVVGGGVVVEQARGGPVESLDLGQHRQIPRPGQGRPGREQPAEAAGARVLEAAAVVAHRHRHVGVLGGDAEIVEQPAQRGVGAVVVNQERGVDADDVAVAAVEEVGMGVPADPAVGLEQGDLVAGRQQVGRRQPGDPAADDGDKAPAWLIWFHTRYSERPRVRMGNASTAGSRGRPGCRREGPRPASTRRRSCVNVIEMAGPSAVFAMKLWNPSTSPPCPHAVLTARQRSMLGQARVRNSGSPSPCSGHRDGVHHLFQLRPGDDAAVEQRGDERGEVLAGRHQAFRTCPSPEAIRDSVTSVEPTVDKLVAVRKRCTQAACRRRAGK